MKHDTGGERAADRDLASERAKVGEGVARRLSLPVRLVAGLAGLCTAGSLAVAGGTPGSAAIGLGSAAAIGVELAKPSAAQLAWADSEIGMFIHFGPRTWSEKDTDSVLDVAMIEMDPMELDATQWVSVAESLGAKYIVFTAKSNGGFCNWKTKTADYSIRRCGWKGGSLDVGGGDVLKELAEACKARGMKLGVSFASFDETLHSGPLGVCPDPMFQPPYDDLYRRQLTEVLSGYGPLFGIWLDGITRVDPSDIIAKHAPDALVSRGRRASLRWSDAVDGRIPYPTWGAATHDGAERVATIAESSPDGVAWMPVEVAVPLRDSWYHRSTNLASIKSVSSLVDVYEGSVGRGGGLLIGISPDTRGLIPDEDAARAAAFGAEVRRLYGAPLATAAADGAATMEIKLSTAAKVDRVVIQEDVVNGQRIREYVIEASVAGAWKQVATGTAVGHKRIQRFDPVEATGLRLRVLKAAGEPVVKKFAVFGGN